MFAYNPSVNNTSGAILGAGQASAAATNAQATANMGQDIGGALMMVAKAYTDNETAKAEGKAFLNTLGIMAPALGISEDQLKQIKGSFKRPQDAAVAARQMLSVAPSLINHNMAVIRPGNQMKVAGYQGTVDTIVDQNQATIKNETPVRFNGSKLDAWSKASYLNGQ
jgi:hypothetical protein